MILADFWPTPEAVAQCIPSEAEVIADAAFLAVHQPMKLFRRSLTDPSAVSVPADERSVLNQLLKEHLPEGYVIVPIVGPSGVGKSHLIRWLGLHVSDNHRRHVIRIPKSTSLRRILESILDGLTSPAFAEIREQLKSAREQLDEIAAEELLLAHFRTALRRRMEEAKSLCDEQLRQFGKVDPVVRSVMETHGPGLVSLLEGETKKVLLEGTSELPSVFSSLIRRVTIGIIEAEHGEFKPEHFAFSKVTVKDTRSYVSKLKTNNLNYRDSAAKLMNEVRDGAVGQLLGLGENQLADLFRRVREELLRENRELILLIEDFTTLAGVQRGLLDVIKMEGVHAGKQVLCPLRTAMAVTEGYLSDYDTIKTRVGQEFVLREQSADEAVLLETITDMVGAYLNAARLGAKQLDDWFAGTGHDPNKKPPSFEKNASNLLDADRKKLTAFGMSNLGHSLFPFNRAAVRQLAGQHLTPGTELLLNPRKLIKDVIHATLDQRDVFLRGEFPAEGFQNFNVNRLGIDVRQWLKQYRLPDQARYEVLFGYWGNRPGRHDELKLPAAVYSAFGLVPLSQGALEVPPQHLPAKVVAGPKSPIAIADSKPERDLTQERIDKRLDILKRWAAEKKIAQLDANALRRDLLEMIDDAIDWNSELHSVPRDFSKTKKVIRPVEDEAEEDEDESVEVPKFPRAPLTDAVGTSKVYLPFSQSGMDLKADEAIFTVCPDDAIELLDVQFELRALVRFHTRRTFDYEGGDEDRVWYARLCDRAVRQAVPFLRKRYERVPDNDAAIEAVTQALYISARILNLEGAHSNQDDDVLKAVLHAGPNILPAPGAFGDRWTEFRRLCADKRVVARDFLLRRLSASQGKGDILFGIDSVRVLKALKPARKTCRTMAGFPGRKEELDENAQQVRDFVNAVGEGPTEAAVRHRRDSLIKWANETRTWLGANFDKKVFVKRCAELMTHAKNLSVFRADVEYETLRSYLKAFDEAAVSEAIGAVDRIKEDATPGVVLTALVQAPDDAMEVARKFRLAFTAFVDRTFPLALSKVLETLQLVGADLNADPKTLLPAEGRKLDDDLKAIVDAFPEEIP